MMGRSTRISHVSNCAPRSNRCWLTVQHSIETVRYPVSRMANLPLSKQRPHRVSLRSHRGKAMNENMLTFLVKQNAAKAPLIQRRPSRVIAAGPTRARPSQQGRPTVQHQDSSASVSSSLSSDVPMTSASAAMKGSVGLSSALSQPVLLRVRVAAGADVHFTTTISVYVNRIPSLLFPLPFEHTK